VKSIMHPRGLLFAVVAVALSSPPVPAVGADAAEKQSYIPIVRAFAENVLKYGRDIYGPDHTPLLIDGINIDTHEPAVWQLGSEHVKQWDMPARWVLSNLASQQNLFRVFVVLSQLEGNPKYKQAAIDATRYMFEHYRHESGLLFWGGHAAVDLMSGKPVGEGRTGDYAGKHELKSHYPFYELMWEVDPKATRKLLEGAWSNHILDWGNLDMNRHALCKPISPTLWEETYLGGPVPFVGKGLTFMLTGSDLFYAGAMLSELTGDDRPLAWGKRMAKRYVDVRDPKTGLGADNYSTEPTNRMKQQFGPEFGDRFTEATVTSLYGNRYNRSAICQLKLAEKLGPKGEEFGRWAVEDLTAYAKFAYDPADHSFWPTLIDGTKLTPADRKREGYVEVRWLQKRPADALHFWAYALAYKLSRDELMWRTARSIGTGLDLGDIGESTGGNRALHLATSHADANTIFGLLELHAATKDNTFLTLARAVGDNVVRREYHKGFFTGGPDHLFSKFDTISPLALLYLEVTERRLPVKLPVYAGGKSYLHCYFDGLRTYDHQVIYGRLRGRN
jgi:pectate lyase